MVAGENYYAAATAEQRAGNIPVHPFVTVRLPTLAAIHALIGIKGARTLAIGLLGAARLALYRRLLPSTSLTERAGALGLFSAGGIAMAIPDGGWCTKS